MKILIIAESNSADSDQSQLVTHTLRDLFLEESTVAAMPDRNVSITNKVSTQGIACIRAAAKDMNTFDAIYVTTNQPFGNPVVLLDDRLPVSAHQSSLLVCYVTGQPLADNSKFRLQEFKTGDFTLMVGAISWHYEDYLRLALDFLKRLAFQRERTSGRRGTI